MDNVSLLSSRTTEYSTIDSVSLIECASEDIQSGGVIGSFWEELADDLTSEDSGMSFYTGKYFYVYSGDVENYRLSIDNYGLKSTYADCYSDAFLSDLACLENNTLDYETFFDRYGTHIIGSALYGGKLRAYCAVLVKDIVMDENIKDALDQLILSTGIQNVSAESVVSALNQVCSLPVEENDVRIDFNVAAEGGMPISNLPSLFQEDYKEWCDSVFDIDECTIIGFASDGLVPLWEILPEDYDSLSVKMQNAFCGYYDRNASDFYEKFGQGDEKEDPSLASKDGVVQDTTGTPGDVLRSDENADSALIVMWSVIGAVGLIALFAGGFYIFKRNSKSKN